MNPTDDSDREARLQEALVEYLDMLDTGEEIDTDAFLAKYADVRSELEEYLADRAKLDSMLEPIRSERYGEPTLGPNSSETPAPGSQVRYFGDYELLEEVARGGMGVVFKARQVNLNRTVALKMILAGQLAGEDEVNRFHAEAEAAARLDHPNIVPIFEIGQHEGQHYFSMAFVDGESLSHRISRGVFGPTEAAELMIQVSEAISYAHVEGVIHRDIKPGNILIEASGRPRVTDFGLAKRVEADCELTSTGQVLGSPSYMPPEQAEANADKIGPHSDVYSLGAVLYCLLTGRPPFQASTVVDTLMQVLHQEPVAPRQLDPSIPLDLETICLKCLDKEPARRYSTARELADELQRFVEGKPILARRIGTAARVWRWCRRNPVVAGLSAALVLSLVMGTVAATHFAIEALRQRDIAQLHAHEAHQRANEIEAANKLAERERHRAKIERDRARMHLYTSQLQLAQQAWKSDDAARARELLESCRPDDKGQKRGFEWHYLWGQLERDRCTIDLGDEWKLFGSAFSPDGKHLATAGSPLDAKKNQDGSEIRVWDLDSGKVIRSILRKDINVSGVSVSTDGKSLAGISWAERYTTDEGSGWRDRRRIVVYDIATGKERASLDVTGMSHVTGETVALSDRHLAIGGSWPKAEGREFGVKVWTLSELGKANASPRFFECEEAYGQAFVEFSPGGQWIAWKKKSGSPITMTKADGSEAKQLGERACEALAFSPDGERAVLWSFYGKIGSDFQAEVWDVAEGKLLRTITTPRIIRTAALSRDGKHVLVGSGPVIEIWDVGTGTLSQSLKGHTDDVVRLATTTDGRSVVSVANNIAKVWDRDAESGLTKRTGEEWLADVSVAAGSNIVATAGRESVTLWDRTGKRLDELKQDKLPKFYPRGLSFSSAGSLLAVTGLGEDDQRRQEYHVQLWKITQEKEDIAAELVRSIPTPRLRVNIRGLASAILSPDGRTLAYPHADGWPRGRSGESVRLLDLKTSKERRIPKDSGDWFPYREALDFQRLDEFQALAFSPDGKRLASAHPRHLVIWDIESTKPVFVVESYSNAGLAFSPDGNTLVSRALGEKGVRLWDVSSTALTHSMSQLRQVHEKVYDPKTNKYRVDAKERWRLSNAAQPKAIRTLRGHAGPVRCIAMSRDGKLLATGSDDRAIKLWDVESGQELITLTGHDATVTALAFDESGTMLVSTDSEGVLRYWPTRLGK